MAKEIHGYIVKHKDWYGKIITSIPKRGDCIEYKHRNKSRNNFLTILADHQVRGLIVRRKGDGGLKLQHELNNESGIVFDRTGFNK